MKVPHGKASAKVRMAFHYAQLSRQMTINQDDNYAHSLGTYSRSLTSFSWDFIVPGRAEWQRMTAPQVTGRPILKVWSLAHHLGREKSILKEREVNREEENGPDGHPLRADRVTLVLVVHMYQAGRSQAYTAPLKQPQDTDHSHNILPAHEADPSVVIVDGPPVVFASGYGIGVRCWESPP